MQIVAVAIYNRRGDLRTLDFKLGGLNILSGKSETGKSTVLDIVDFCLGRDDVALPGGKILEIISWFAVLVQVEDTRILIARENPDTARSSQAMLAIGSADLYFPPVSELRANANTSVLREQLSEWTGVQQFTIEPAPNTLRRPFDVSVRQALLFASKADGNWGTEVSFSPAGSARCA